jgi:phosphatidylglycerophosphatase A
VVGLVLVAALGSLPLEGAWLRALLGVAAVTVFAVGVWAAGQSATFFGRADPGQVVIDEVVGQMIPFLLRPDAGWKWLFVGFVTFRLFDVFKPFPARRAERVPGGWGIMLDDLVAGAYGLGVLALLEVVRK